MVQDENLDSFPLSAPCQACELLLQLQVPAFFPKALGAKSEVSHSLPGSWSPSAGPENTPHIVQWWSGPRSVWHWLGNSSEGGVCPFIGLSPTGSGPGLGAGLGCKKHILNEQINPDGPSLPFPLKTKSQWGFLFVWGFFPTRFLLGGRCLFVCCF